MSDLKWNGWFALSDKQMNIHLLCYLISPFDRRILRRLRNRSYKSAKLNLILVLNHHLDKMLIIIINVKLYTVFLKNVRTVRLWASTQVQYDISTQWHTDARVATLIIVSGWEWYGLAQKCNVLPFYILNSGSHEPLQGDASSDFNRNFSLDTPCYLSPSGNLRQTAPAPFSSNIGIGTILRSVTADGASGGGGGGGGGHSGECRLAVSPDIGLFWSQTPAEWGRVHRISKHCHCRGGLAVRKCCLPLRVD